MNRDWTAQPEASGPLSESALGRASYGDPGMPTIGRIYPPQAYPAADPSAEAIERTLAAERAADQFRSAPADATVIS
jgi:hypothetical protein